MLSVDDHINRKYAFKVSACFHSCEALLDCTIHGCILFDQKKTLVLWKVLKKVGGAKLQMVLQIDGRRSESSFMLWWSEFATVLHCF